MTAPLNQTIDRVTDRVRERSQQTRADYVKRMEHAERQGPHRGALSCGNLAHAFAACGAEDKSKLSADVVANIAIVSAYNDMLSAHQPFEVFPDQIRATIAKHGGMAQFAGGVPAMCDGVTQGQPGMDLSLFSRDVVAQAAAIALSHNMFDGALFLGVCDKIVPGLVIGALAFGHLPALFVPAGPMPSGLPNNEKARIRQEYAQGKVGRDELLKAESESYHSPGTCTFYGTANSNQMLMEMMGMQLPGASFVNPNTPHRDALTDAAVERVMQITALTDNYTPLYKVVDERAIVNGIIGLHATGGSTNHTIHLLAMARAAGVCLTWQDLSDLSGVIPLLCRIYPNGQADVNHFHAAGGMGFLMGQLLEAGLLHGDVTTVAGPNGLQDYVQESWLDQGTLAWRPAAQTSGDTDVLRPADNPFARDGGLRVLHGNIGESVIKVSAVKPEHRLVEAPARVFHEQQELMDAFEAGELDGDFVAVMRFQGPSVNGMPELHKLTPPLGVLQDRGQKVALVTDGRMSGASGKVPAAIHMSPEAASGGAIARIQDGDIIRLDAEAGTLEVLVDAAEFAARTPANPDLSHHTWGMGRELFSAFRTNVTSADTGAMVAGPTHLGIGV